MSSPIDLVLDRVERVQAQSNGWTARCPAHPDNENSLSFCEGQDGRVLVRCHAGCTFAEIVAALGLEQRDCLPTMGGRGYPAPWTGFKPSNTPGKKPRQQLAVTLRRGLGMTLRADRMAMHARPP